jgi:hypothetical protein
MRGLLRRREGAIVCGFEVLWNRLAKGSG